MTCDSDGANRACVLIIGRMKFSAYLASLLVASLLRRNNSSSGSINTGKHFWILLYVAGVELDNRSGRMLQEAAALVGNVCVHSPKLCSWPSRPRGWDEMRCIPGHGGDLMKLATFVGGRVTSRSGHRPFVVTGNEPTE